MAEGILVMVVITAVTANSDAAAKKLVIKQDMNVKLILEMVLSMALNLTLN